MEQNFFFYRRQSDDKLRLRRLMILLFWENNSLPEIKQLFALSDVISGCDLRSGFSLSESCCSGAGQINALLLSAVILYIEWAVIILTDGQLLTLPGQTNSNHACNQSMQALPL